MASRCLLQSGSLLLRLSKLSIARDVARANATNFMFWQTPANNNIARFFSDIKGDNGITKKKKEIPDTDDDLLVAPEVFLDEDPFGVNFEDGVEKLGPEDSLPPIYKRDAATGRLTGDVKRELTEEEKRILKADPLEQEKILLHRLEKHWEKSGVDEIGQPAALNKLGERVRRSDMALSVIGRTVRSQSEKSEDDSQWQGTRFSKHLTKPEFAAFSAFAEQKYKVEVDEDQIPVSGPSRKKYSAPVEDDVDSENLALKWLTARAQRQMDDTSDDNPYSDLMPGDLSPSRLVNRKRAKQIPTKVLHHNNIPLLQRFVSPTGQIKSRVQTRLGARDQRRVAKLIKRARSLGLMPYVGQQKVEAHGWIHEPDIHEDRQWEAELKHRGLVIKRKKGHTDDE